MLLDQLLTRTRYELRQRQEQSRGKRVKSASLSVFAQAWSVSRKKRFNLPRGSTHARCIRIHQFPDAHKKGTRLVSQRRLRHISVRSSTKQEEHQTHFKGVLLLILNCFRDRKRKRETRHPSARRPPSSRLLQKRKLFDKTRCTRALT
jgi:hypothetical protein